MTRSTASSFEFWRDFSRNGQHVRPALCARPQRRQVRRTSSSYDNDLRPYMEDRYHCASDENGTRFYGVFDGHGGKEVRCLLAS
jgi:hypothetical protein